MKGCHLGGYDVIGSEFGKFPVEQIRNHGSQLGGDEMVVWILVEHFHVVFGDEFFF